MLTLRLSPRRQLWHTTAFRAARRAGFEVVPAAHDDDPDEMRTYALLTQDQLMLWCAVGPCERALHEIAPAGMRSRRRPERGAH